MVIAHLPSGYLLSRFLFDRLGLSSGSKGILMFLGLLGAIFPDFDLIYFYWVDHGLVHHHRYFIHWPSFWLLLSIISVLWLKLSPLWISASAVKYAPLFFSLGGLSHVFLDAYVGDLWLFAPFYDKSFSLFHVPARYKPWWLNFIWHWTFIAELLLCVWAGIVYKKRGLL